MLLLKTNHNWYYHPDESCHHPTSTANTAARLTLLKHKWNHVTFLCKTTQSFSIQPKFSWPKRAVHDLHPPHHLSALIPSALPVTHYIPATRNSAQSWTFQACSCHAVFYLLFSLLGKFFPRYTHSSHSHIFLGLCSNVTLSERLSFTILFKHSFPATLYPVIYSFIVCCLLLEFKVLENRLCLVCLLIYPQLLEQHLSTQ